MKSRYSSFCAYPPPGLHLYRLSLDGKLEDPAKFAPLGDNQVAGSVKRDRMRGVADAVGPLRGFQTEVGPLRFVGIITDLGYDAIVLPKDRYASLQLGDSDVVARDVRCRWHTQIALQHFHQVAVS